MTYPGTYSCPPPPLCQHRWYLTAHPWTWCWCFTDTGKAFQSLSFQHKDEWFGPELLWKSARWLVSSLHLCSICDWGNCFENIHTDFSNLLYSKGKMTGLQRHLASPSAWIWGSVQVPVDTEIHSNTELEKCELSYYLWDKLYSPHVNKNPADITHYPRVITVYWNYHGNVFLNPCFVRSWEKENCHEENVMVVEVHLQQSQEVSKASSEFKYIMC